jgi:hypothetical protein
VPEGSPKVLAMLACLPLGVTELVTLRSFERVSFCVVVVMYLLLLFLPTTASYYFLGTNPSSLAVHSLLSIVVLETPPINFLAVS